jgi:hypothetical protein
MISSITKEIGGKPETFRLKTRAKRAIEGRLGKGIVALAQSLGSDFSINTLTVMLAESMNNGDGADDAKAEALIDEIGDEEAANLLGQIFEAAFPEAGASEKNVKGAARSK